MILYCKNYKKREESLWKKYYKEVKENDEIGNLIKSYKENKKLPENIEIEEENTKTIIKQKLKESIKDSGEIEEQSNLTWGNQVTSDTYNTVFSSKSGTKYPPSSWKPVPYIINQYSSTVGVT